MARKKQAETPTPETQPHLIIALSDLPDRRMTITIIISDEESIQFKGVLLSYKRWNELGRLVPDPMPSVSGFDSVRRPIYNLYDPVYLNQKETAGEKRTFYRLIEFLEMDIPGDTLDEKVKALEDALEFKVMRALIEAISKEHLERAEVDVSARAATFLSA